MSELLQMVGPDAIRNLLMNWPFAAGLLVFMWLMWRQLVTCYGHLSAITDKLLAEHTGNDNTQHD